MSTEIEAAGALLDGSLVAHEIEGAKLGGAHGAGHGACLNCGAALHGRFCANCGQGAHVHRSLLHLVEELLHGLFHFDAKGWRTLPLLVARPGLLTRRYVDGQRMRYVSPLALFLFMVFLMFFVASLSPSPPDVFGNSGDLITAKVDTERELDKARAALAKQEAELARVKASGRDTADAEEEVASAKADVEEAQIAATAVAHAASAASTLGAAASAASAASAAAAAASAGDAEAGAHAVPAWAQVLREKPMKSGHPRLDAAVKRAADNPELTVYKLKNTAYKYSFMLVPISLPFLWLLFFWRRGIAMYDHAVFVLYSLSFMSLLFVALVGLAALHAGGFVALLATFAPPLHMAAQLKETYRLGWWGTLWRTVALLVVSAVVFALFLLLIVYVTMG